MFWFKNKKGFVFTSIVIVVFLFLVLLNPSSNLDTRYKEIHKWQSLVRKSNQLLIEIESYQIPLVVRSIGYHAISEMANDDEYSFGSTPYSSIDEIESDFKEYIKGTKGDLEINLDSFLLKLAENFKMMNYDFSYDLSNIKVNLSQDEPFALRVNLSFPYNLSASKNGQVFKVMRNATVSTTIPLVGVYDPLTTAATRGSYKIRINIGPSEAIFDYEKAFGVDLSSEDRTLIECQEQYDSNIANKTCLDALIENHWFIYSPDAPSFLNRMLLNTSPSNNGITTIWNKSIVQDASTNIRGNNIGVINWSYADYCQYQENPTENCFFSNETCKMLANESFGTDYVLIDLQNYAFIMNLTAYAEKPDSETIEYDNECKNEMLIP
ncbi:MAG: hypothetical protein PWP03_202 [Candidatus Woesearchaeota archaeon]|nr:hypothetical protein [Candidatus Woesearchaeota archaeon]